MIPIALAYKLQGRPARFRGCEWPLLLLAFDAGLYCRVLLLGSTAGMLGCRAAGLPGCRTALLLCCCAALLLRCDALGCWAVCCWAPSPGVSQGHSLGENKAWTLSSSDEPKAARAGKGRSLDESCKVLPEQKCKGMRSNYALIVMSACLTQRPAPRDASQKGM